MSAGALTRIGGVNLLALGLAIIPIYGEDSRNKENLCPTTQLSPSSLADSCNGQGMGFMKQLFFPCQVEWCKCWKSEELEMKPVEKAHPGLCGCHSYLTSLLWCPPKQNNDNGQAEQDSETENGGNGSDLNPLMQAMKIHLPDFYSFMDAQQIRLYGWVQQGLTFNFDGPSDRTNFGTSFNLRSNDYRLNQVYLVLEKTLAENKQDYSWGFRWDFFTGHDAPFLANISLGLFDNFTGGSFNSVGIEMPQFYVEAHLPILTTNGVDVRVGRFYTYHEYELTPAALTDFYSHAYGFFFGPFTHTGVIFTVYLGDTFQLMNGIVRGWDVVFEDNNDSPSWHGSLKYTSCDQRTIAYITWMVGPELPNNNHDLRTYITYDLIRKFGTYDPWKVGLNFGTAWESHSAPGGGTARWQEGAFYLFYTIDPRLILGFRAEIYNDEDGVRTGFADRFHEITLGLTYKPYKNLRIRPEIRFDWSDKTRPFNDLQDKSQQTAAFDIIWEF